MDKKLRNKQGQQEIVGFMIIILIVIIVGVIFLGIYIRNDKPIVKDDAELRNFLSASMRYTTECYKDNEPNYRTLQDLSGDCYQKGSQKITCPDGKDSCQVLNSTYNWMLTKLWPSGKDRPIKYTKMSFQYVQNTSSSEGNIYMRIKQGNESGCLTIKSAQTAISLDEGKVLVQMEICKGN